jgi:hypothetical protein
MTEDFLEGVCLFRLSEEKKQMEKGGDIMKIRKNMIVAIMITFCFTAMLFMIIPIRGGTYDPNIDSNHDGKINLVDLGLLAKAYSTSGDPMLNVSIQPLPGAWYIYSIPFIVGVNINLNPPSPYGLGPGVYDTDILVHNPNPWLNVTITKKIVIAPEENVLSPAPHFFETMVLWPDYAFRIDSAEIWSLLENYYPYPYNLPAYNVTKGWIGLISWANNLDVIAYYTVSDLAGSGVPYTSGHTESIESVTITPKLYQIPYTPIPGLG